MYGVWYFITADEVAGRQFLRELCIAFIQWNHSFSLVNIFYQVIDSFHIVAIVTRESTLAKRK